MSLMEYKQVYIDIVKEYCDYANKYKLDNLNAEKKINEIETFKVTVPLVGGFSSGKSTIVNTLIKEKLLATSIAPETAVPTELEYSDIESIKANINGTWSEISKSSLKDNNFSINNTKLISVHIKNNFLESIQNVQLADIPGLDSGIREHSIAIDNYISKSIAYIITVDSEQGLRNSILNFLEELKLYDIPILIVITKSDKKSEDDLKKLIDDVKFKVEEKLGLEDILVEPVSSKNNDVDPVAKFLLKVQSQSEDLFKKKFSQELKSDIGLIERYIATRIKEKDSSLEDIDKKESELKLQIEGVIDRLRIEQDKFKESIDKTSDIIKGKVRIELEQSLDSMVNDTLSNRSLDDKVKSLVRKSIMVSIKQELEPKLQKYFKNISEILEGDINVDNTVVMDDISITMNSHLETLIKKSIPAIMTAVGFALTGPLGAFIVGALSILIEGLFSKKRQEDKRRVVENKIRDEVIPNIALQVNSSLDETMTSYLEEVSEKIELSIIKDKESKEKSLQDLRTQKQLKLEEQEKMINELSIDLEKVRCLYERI